jgi:hypothetical protein
MEGALPHTSHSSLRPRSLTLRIRLSLPSRTRRVPDKGGPSHGTWALSPRQRARAAASFITSRARRQPTMPVTGPSTPASAQSDTSSDGGATGCKQR